MASLAHVMHHTGRMVLTLSLVPFSISPPLRTLGSGHVYNRTPRHFKSSSHLVTSLTILAILGAFVLSARWTLTEGPRRQTKLDAKLSPIAVTLTSHGGVPHPWSGIAGRWHGAGLFLPPGAPYVHTQRHIYCYFHTTTQC
jgi:hypothetical protein